MRHLTALTYGPRSAQCIGCSDTNHIAEFQARQSGGARHGCEPRERGIGQRMHSVSRRDTLRVMPHTGVGTSPAPWTSPHNSNAHGARGADDGAADGLQRDKLAAWVSLLHLRGRRRRARSAAPPTIRLSAKGMRVQARLRNLEDVLQGHRAAHLVPRLLAARGYACKRSREQ